MPGLLGQDPPHRRAAELREALTIWEASGHAASLVTITVPHDLDDPALTARRRPASRTEAHPGRWILAAAQAAPPIVGHIIALGFTWADENGSHPHYHVLLVHDQDLDGSAIAPLHGHIHSRLAVSCRGSGLRRPDQLHAVRIASNVSGAYLAKGGAWTTAEVA